MNERPIIQSILDTDLYKFTTGYAYSKLYPRAYGHFTFVDRDKTIYPKGFAKLVETEINKMADLALTQEEARFLAKECPYLPNLYRSIEGLPLRPL